MPSCVGKDLDGVAYTAGPGLVGALLVGTSVGRSLAYAWDIPAVAVHHMEAHLLAPMLEEESPILSLSGLTGFRWAYTIDAGQCCR